MPNIAEFLSGLSLRDVKRMVKAKALQAKREALELKARTWTALLEGAHNQIHKLDSKIESLLKNGRPGRGRAATKRSGRGGRKARGSRGPRKGSLRSFLINALKSLGKSVTVRELAQAVLKAGYKTKSKLDVFIRATNQAVAVNPEFARKGGKVSLK